MKAGASVRFERRLSAYRDVLSRIHAAAAAIARAEVVVDSTKLPPFAYVVRGIDDVDLRLVHLVRDSRGVAYSWMKSRQRPEVTNAEAYVDRYAR
jgi:hypothetical protein